jgi:hypothetical protein
MEFFIPAATSDQQRDEVYDAIRKHVGDFAGLSQRRIRLLEWRHEGKQYRAEVGKKTNFNGEPVIAILYDEVRDLYHVCTPNRGVVRGGSIFAGGGHLISEVEDFTPAMV